MSPTNREIIEYENLKRLNEPFEKEYIQSFQNTISSGWYILGKNVENFENEFAAFSNNKYCIGVASGLDALTLSLIVCNFKKGSEVIVPSNTYIATILSIMQAGLVPILVEPDIQTYNIDPLKIEEKISPKTVAILVVHLYGKCCEMDKILVLSNQYNLKVVEDCAQSHGAEFKGKKAGSFGDFAAWSFYPTKNLGALGDAGAITCNNHEFYVRLKMLRNYGSKVKYYNEEIGVNSRLDEIQAGFLSIKLKKLDEINNHKRKLASIYQKEVSNDVIKPVIDDNYFDVYHIYCIRTNKRDELKSYLLNEGIKTEIHYPVAPADQVAMALEFKNIKTPIAKEIHQTILSLPISYFHSEEEVKHISQTINKFYK